MQQENGRHHATREKQYMKRLLLTHEISVMRKRTEAKADLLLCTVLVCFETCRCAWVSAIAYLMKFATSAGLDGRMMMHRSENISLPHCGTALLFSRLYCRCSSLHPSQQHVMRKVEVLLQSTVKGTCHLVMIISKDADILIAVTANAAYFVSIIPLRAADKYSLSWSWWSQAPAEQACLDLPL